MTNKNTSYSFYSIEKDLIIELENNKKEILDYHKNKISDEDYLYQFVDKILPDCPYDLLMIFAKNWNELWGISQYHGENIQDYFVESIYDYLLEIAHEWVTILKTGVTNIEWAEEIKRR